MVWWHHAAWIGRKTVGPKINASERQVMVQPLELAVAKHIEVVGRTGREFAEDIAGFGADRWPSSPMITTFFDPKPSSVRGRRVVIT